MNEDKWTKLWSDPFPPLSMEALYWDHTLSRAFYFQYGRAFIVTV
jgi:hypothetical protein